MLILNTGITVNSRPARIFSFQKRQPINNVDVYILCLCLLLRRPPIS